MEISMHNIPIKFHEEHTLKNVLARHLHGPDFPHIKANFRLNLHWSKKGNTTGTCTITLADLFVGERFLEIHGGRHPRKIIEIGGNKIYFLKSIHQPHPDVLELLSRSPWVDPAIESEQQKHFQKLSSSHLPVDVIQFGWTCRDRVFSIEGEESKRRCDLTFDPERNEIHLRILREAPNLNTHVIAIQYSSILSVSAHTLKRESVVHFQLEIPPRFLRRKHDNRPFYRASALPFQTLNPRSTPYIILSIRVVLGRGNTLNQFRELAKIAKLHHIQGFQVPIARRSLFTIANLDFLEECIKAFEWRVAFQLEALLRKLDVDAQELIGILPRVRELVEKHGCHYVGALLRKFAGQVRYVPCSDGRNSVESVLNCLNESHEQFMAHATFSIPSEEVLCHSFHLTVTPTTVFLTGPFLEKLNRVIRRYERANQECFLRVEFREEDGLKYQFDHGVNGRAFIQDRVGPILKEGIVVAG